MFGHFGHNRANFGHPQAMNGGPQSEKRFITSNGLYWAVFGRIGLHRAVNIMDCTRLYCAVLDSTGLH